MTKFIIDMQNWGQKSCLRPGSTMKPWFGHESPLRCSMIGAVQSPETEEIWRSAPIFGQSEELSRMLRELPDLSVDFTSAAWSIVRRGIVILKSQAGSAEMCREIRRQTGSGTKCIFSLRRNSYLYIC
jgi:hypothetical protein